MTKATEQKKENPTQAKAEEGQVPPHLGAIADLEGWPTWQQFKKFLKENKQALKKVGKG